MSVLRRVAVAAAQRRQLVAQRAPDLHLAPPGVGLGLPDVQPAAREVHVTPPQLAQLRDSQPGEHEHREHRAALDMPAILRRVAVQFARRVEQRPNLPGAVQVGAHRRAFAHPPRLPLCWIAGDQLALHGPLKDRSEQRQRHVDRPGRQRIVFRELRGDVALHGVERDRVQPQLPEVRRQMHGQPPPVVSTRAWRELAVHERPPLHPELSERRGRLRLRRRGDGGRRLPYPALNVSERVTQSRLGLLLADRTERHTATFAVRGEPKRAVHLPVPADVFRDFALRWTRHRSVSPSASGDPHASASIWSLASLSTR